MHFIWKDTVGTTEVVKGFETTQILASQFFTTKTEPKEGEESKDVEVLILTLIPKTKQEKQILDLNGLPVKQKVKGQIVYKTRIVEDHVQLQFNSIDYPDVIAKWKKFISE